LHALAHDGLGFRRQRRQLRGAEALGLIKPRLPGDARRADPAPGPRPVGILRLIECERVRAGESKAGCKRGSADQAAIKHGMFLLGISLWIWLLTVLRNCAAGSGSVESFRYS